MRIFVVLIAIVLLFLIFKTFSRSSPQFAKKLLSQLAIGAGIVLFIFLLATGRLHWLFALVAATLPFLRRLLPLLRFLPMASQFFRQRQTKSTEQPSTGQQSSVESNYLRMSLDHDTGNMDGEILAGSRQGQRLSALNLQELLELYQEFSTDDDSQALLHSYLDRHHPDWITQAESYQKTAHTTPSTDMSEAEARQILGVSDTAMEEEIVTSHRRLMQKVHPDHGGSAYLAAKINLAKDRLLG
ncbi:MAG: molecular chaperone DnaJ [Thiohalomonadales bacterium]